MKQQELKELKEIRQRYQVDFAVLEAFVVHGTENIINKEYSMAMLNAIINYLDKQIENGYGGYKNRS